MPQDSHQLLDLQLLSKMGQSPQLALLRHTLAHHRPPNEQRIFVNRTLRMDKIQHVGFDLDWTLADYHRDNMSQLAFELTLDRLVERHGYSRNALKAEFRSDFCRRGLILDRQEGTVLKMNRHRYVGRAYHGRSFLEPNLRSELYRREPINPASDRFYFVDTLFELPEVNIFSEVIDLHLRDKAKMPLESYSKLFKDTRFAIDSIHADGSLKKEILGRLDHYLPSDPQLAGALERIALSGSKLLLITNSEWYYTDGLCRHLFEGALPGLDHWTDLFDLIVVSAGKPGFFRKARPFIELEDGKEIGETRVPDWGKVYSGGSREGLMELLDVPGENVLYVGDHIYGDVVSSKLSSTWRTALVVSELEEELHVRQRLTSQHRHIGVLRSELAELGLAMDDLKDILQLYENIDLRSPDAVQERHRELDVIRQRIEQLRKEHKAMRRLAARIQSRISKAINPYWGSLFKQGGNKSLFGSQVDDFACLYTSRVRNFAHYGSRHYFRVSADPMRHEIEL